MRQRVRKVIRGNVFLWVLIGGAMILLGLDTLTSEIIPYFQSWRSGGVTWTNTDFLTQSVPEEDVYFFNVATVSRGDTGYTNELRLMRIPLPFAKSYYGVALVARNTLIVFKSTTPIPSWDYKRTVLTGVLRDFDRDETEILTEFEKEDPLGEDVDMYPRVLDMSDVEYGWLYIPRTLFLLGMIGVGGYFLIRRGLIYFFRRNPHPIWTSLERYGLPVDSLLDSISTYEHDVLHKAKNMKFTREWLIFDDGIQFKVMKIQDIVWIHENIRVNSFLAPTSYHIYDRYGEWLELSIGKAAEADTIRNMLIKRIPWALVGTNPEATRIWKENRAEFVRQVDERKHILQSGEAKPVSDDLPSAGNA